MVNKTVLEYLRVNKGNYNFVDLKKKILSSGYSQQHIDEAMVKLNKETKGSAPSVATTIKKINKINLKETSPSTPHTTRSKPAKTVKPAKKKTKIFSKKLLWIILIIFGILVIGGAAVWFFFG